LGALGLVNVGEEDAKCPTDAAMGRCVFIGPAIVAGTVSLQTELPIP
jgi:hypothetical protein